MEDVHSDPAEEEFSGATYRCRDPIANFRVRVRIRRVQTATTTDSSGLTDSNESIRSAAAAANDDIDDVTLGWQQKIFNASEFQRYSLAREDDFGDSVLQKKFYHDVRTMLKNGETVPKNRIYTTVDGELISQDKFQSHREFPLTTDSTDEPNFLSVMMADGLRHRTQNGSSGTEAIPKRNIVNATPSRDTQLRLHTISAILQTMIIRFDCSDDSEESEQIDLCVLKFDHNGVLTVTPDFTHSKKPYRFEVHHKTKDIFEYWLDHVSPSMEYEDQLRETMMLNDVYSRHVQLRRSEVGMDFEMPPKRSLRLHVNGEIVSARNFDYDGLVVHYFVELPTGWTASEDSTLTGMTQTCFTTVDGSTGEDVAHYSYLFSMDLYFDINRLDLNAEALPKWPQIFIEVLSIDQWTRCRTEGYGFLSFPHTPGRFDLTVSTWRPILPGPKTEMQRYFVGGTPELEDITFSGTPGHLDGLVLSRYGFRTVSTGSVQLRLDVIHQAQVFRGAKDVQSKRHFLIDRLSAATLFSSVTTVLEAFKKARERITRATEGFENAVAGH